MFQIPHLLVLFVTALLTAGVYKGTRLLPYGTVVRILKSCAVLMLFFDPIYWLWELRHFGVLNPATTLPLYLCSLFWLLLPPAMFARHDTFRQMACAAVCTLGLMCGVFGLVFNVYLNQYPFLSFVPVRSLLYHIMMILVPTAMWSSGYYRPQQQDRLLCFVPVTILVSVCLLLNRIYGWDYCYTAGGIGTPLVHLSSHMPNILFLLILYDGLLLVIQLIFYRQFSRFSLFLTRIIQRIKQ